jgi:Cu(I)/Ag(I) efflux system membrane fusion protein
VSQQWKSGMQAQVFIKDTQANSIFVPTDAVIRDQQGAYVFIKTAENTFAPRSVKTGAESFASIEIKEGVSAGETLVVSGTYLLYSELILKNGSESLAHIHHDNK